MFLREYDRFNSQAVTIAASVAKRHKRAYPSTPTNAKQVFNFRMEYVLRSYSVVQYRPNGIYKRSNRAATLEEEYYPNWAMNIRPGPFNYPAITNRGKTAKCYLIPRWSSKPEYLGDSGWLDGRPLSISPIILFTYLKPAAGDKLIHFLSFFCYVDLETTWYQYILFTLGLAESRNFFSSSIGWYYYRPQILMKFRFINLLYLLSLPLLLFAFPEAIFETWNRNSADRDIPNDGRIWEFSPGFIWWIGLILIHENQELLHVMKLLLFCSSDIGILYCSF